MWHCTEPCQSGEGNYSYSFDNDLNTSGWLTDYGPSDFTLRWAGDLLKLPTKRQGQSCLKCVFLHHAYPTHCSTTSTFAWTNLTAGMISYSMRIYTKSPWYDSSRAEVPLAITNLPAHVSISSQEYRCSWLGKIKGTSWRFVRTHALAYKNFCSCWNVIFGKAYWYHI